MTKKTAPGGEVDAYCTKCRLDLSHRIVAMVDETIKRVECQTCGGQHNYRPPKGAKAAPKTKKRATRKKPSAAAKAAAQAAAKDEQHKQWQEAIVGRPAEDFVPYSPAVALSLGQMVRHAKFGDGVVTEVRAGDKIEVLFEGGSRLLIHNRA